MAVVTTVATTFTSHFVTAHPGTSPLAGAALLHGFQAAFYVLAAIAAVGAVLAAILLESKPAESELGLSGELIGELEAAR